MTLSAGLTALALVIAVVHATPVARQSSTLYGVNTGKPKLTFNGNGHFKIVSFSDMHMGERWGNGSWASWGPANV